MTTGRDAEVVRLRAENARLIGLLEAHGIAWHQPEPSSVPTAAASLTTDEKVAFVYSTQTGHSFHAKLDTHSTANWTVGA